jgi:hypothetical protein
VNISWQTWYPACSTTPGRSKALSGSFQDDGYRNLAAAHNKTVVVDAYVGSATTSIEDVVDAYGLRNIHLMSRIRWVRYTPRAPMLVLTKYSRWDTSA